MDACAHYEEGERLLKYAWDSDSGVDIALLFVAHANGHFQAAIAYAAIVEMERQDNPPAFEKLEPCTVEFCACKAETDDE